MRGTRCYSHQNKQYILIDNNLYFFKFVYPKGRFFLNKFNLVDKQTTVGESIEVKEGLKYMNNYYDVQFFHGN